MLQLALKGLAHEKIAFFNLETTDDYVGIDDLHPLLIDNEEVFLEQDELTKSSGTDLAFQFVAWSTISHLLRPYSNSTIISHSLY